MAINPTHQTWRHIFQRADNYERLDTVLLMLRYLQIKRRSRYLAYLYLKSRCLIAWLNLV
jgi:hypothetical protein